MCALCVTLSLIVNLYRLLCLLCMAVLLQSDEFTSKWWPDSLQFINSVGIITAVGTSQHTRPFFWGQTQFPGLSGLSMRSQPGTVTMLLPLLALCLSKEAFYSILLFWLVHCKRTLRFKSTLRMYCICVCFMVQSHMMSNKILEMQWQTVICAMWYCFSLP